MKKLIILLVCVAIVGGGGYFGYTRYKTSQDKKISVDVVPMDLIAEPAENYEYYSSDLSGEIISANAQSIYVDSEKLIKKVCVEQGQSVKKGDTILEYDMTVVELELAQKENQVKVIEQNIKTAQKEIAEYKTYKPSENMPTEPDEPDVPDEPDIPVDPIEPIVPDDSSIPDEPIEPIETVSTVTAVIKSENKGTKDDPYIINCNEKTKVTKAFMDRIYATHKYAELCVYNENSQFMYKWIINALNIKPASSAQWVVSDGVTLNKETGIISLDTQISHFGLFSVEIPSLQEIQDDTDSSMVDDFSTDTSTDYTDYTDYTDMGTDTGDDTQSYGQTDNSIDENSTDYMYSKAEIAQMISEKEDEIKGLEIDKKSAELDYNNSKKQKTDGKVVAEIDGIVKKIGDATADSGDTSTEDESGDEESADENYGDTGGNDAFAIIEGEGGVEVRCDISELSLPKVPIGSSLTVMSWNTGASCDAEVSQIAGEPTSYSNYNWGENPNNSTYSVFAQLSDSTDFNVGDWVSVSINQTQTTTSNSVYLPIHYVRQENGNYYIMKANESNRLEKQYIKVGKIMYGTSIEVKGGISMTDRICFPYGTDVKEGTRTKDSTEVLYPEN